MKNGKAEEPAWARTAIGANKRLVLKVRLRCGSLSVTTPVSLRCSKRIAWISEFDSCQSTVKQMCVVHEAMNGCKNLKIH